MKSMQPCDFDEELARSAERGEKRRKRANKFKLVEESTPTSAFPVSILALETQARSPLISRLNEQGSSAIPETPPSLKQRLERMRREQQLLLSTDDEISPKAAPIEVPLQRRLFSKFTVDALSLDDSSSDEDISKGTSQMVSKLIQRLESGQSDSASSTPSLKEAQNVNRLSQHNNHQSPKCQGVEKALISNDHFTTKSNDLDAVFIRQDCSENNAQNNIQPLTTKTKEKHSDQCSSSLAQTLSLGNCHTSSVFQEMSMQEETSSKKIDKNIASSIMSDQMKEKKSPVKSRQKLLRIGRSKSMRNHPSGFRQSDNSNVHSESESAGVNRMTGNGECKDSKSTSSSECAKERILSLNQKVNILEQNAAVENTSLEKCRANSSVDVESTSKVKSYPGKINSIDTKRRTSKRKSVHLKTETETNESETASTNSDAPLKPKVTNKKKHLFTEPVAAMSLFEADIKSSSESLVIHRPDMETESNKPKAGKGKRGRKRNSDVEFLFQGKKDYDEMNNQSRKKRRRLSVEPLNYGVTDCNSSNFSKAAKKSGNNFSKNSHKSNDRQSKLMPDESAMTSVNCTLGTSRANNTLGTSMSIMYENNISTLPNTSTLTSSRRSIDEFSLGKAAKGRQRKKTTTLSKSSLSDIKEKAENEGQAVIKYDESRRKNKSTSKTSISNCTVSRGKQFTSESSSGEGEETMKTPPKLRHARSLLMEESINGGADKSRPALVMTSLHRDEQELIYAVVKKLRVFHMTNNVEASTTHVLCGEPRRTMNVLKAIARGCWLLRKNWALESLETGGWLAEQDFEMAREYPAAKRSRCQRQASGPDYRVDLFSSHGYIYLSKDCAPPKKELARLVQLCSGHVTSCEDKATLYIGPEYQPNTQVIKPTWILDCIEKLELLPIDDYVACPPLNQSQRESSPEF